MQIIVTHGSLARTRALQLGAWHIFSAVAAALVLMFALSVLAYHFLFLGGAVDGRPAEARALLQRERVVRENLHAMAERIGEIQARLVRLEAVSERLSGMVGVKPDELPAKATAGLGGPFQPAMRPSLEQLGRTMTQLEELTQQHFEVLALLESRLFEQRLDQLMVPSISPVTAPIGSGFGFRLDPFTGRSALHTGLDFTAEIGAPIVAAAGGVVQVAERHPQYGLMVDLDHGNGLVTRYAHASRLAVGAGDVVRRGQVIAHVGSTGRSTGPHLHFEVLVDGVPQDPAKFLAGRGPASPSHARR